MAKNTIARTVNHPEFGKPFKGSHEAFGNHLSAISRQAFKLIADG